jgi:hypothetical protein
MTDADDPLHLDSDLDARLCRLLVGWDAFEQRNGAKPIIDFNVSGIVDGDQAVRPAPLSDLRRATRS